MAADTVRDRRILITGGAGFIGSHLAAALAPDNDVVVFDDLSTGSQETLPDDVTVVRGDIRDESALATAMEGMDIVFHEAAMVSVPESVDRPLACNEVNGSATVTLLDRARRVDARVVLASSAAIYGDPETVPVSEAARKQPRSPYGFEKLLTDQYAQFYADTYGLETVPLRYFNVYGPGGIDGAYAGVIGTFLRQAMAGDPLTVEGDGTQTRDFVYVDDVVRANLLAATTDATGVPFNVGTGTQTSIAALASAVRDAVGVTVPITHVDPRPSDIDHSAAETERAADQLGFEAQVSLADGLSATVDAIRR